MKDKKHKPRVVFVQPVLAPYSVPRYQALASAGDMELHVVLEAERFVERPGWLPKEIEGCTIHVVSSLSKQKEVYNHELEYSETFTKAIPYGLTPTLFAISPDMVIFCNPTQLLCALPYLVAKRCIVGLILEDTPVSQAHKSAKICFLRKTIYSLVDCIFCFSEEAAKYARSLGVKARLYRSSWSIEPAWLDHGIQSQRSGEIITFLFVGQLITRKGIMPLLSAWNEFARHDSDKKKLVLVGEGPLRHAAEAFCQKHSLDNVQFAGNVTYEEVEKFYLTSDIFILPTMEDLFSLVITEAMSFGLPVMTTFYNGAKELIINQENGCIFDSKEISSIVWALELMWERQDDLAVMGMRSHEIISDYTHGAVMKRMRIDLHKEFTLIRGQEDS